MDGKGEKISVLKGIICAWLIAIPFIFFGYKVAELHIDWAITRSALFSLICAAWTLVAGIGWAARTRHLVSNIDGSKPPEGSSLDITLRYINNTTEQLILFAIACMALAYAAPSVAKTLLPVMGVWFVIARALFWFGYRHNPLQRAVGFAGTFHPTLALLIFASYKMAF